MSHCILPHTKKKPGEIHIHVHIPNHDRVIHIRNQDGGHTTTGTLA